MAVTFEDLKNLISELRNDLSRYDIQDVFGYAFVELSGIDWTKPQEMNLHSPFRQCGYIASLALSVEESDRRLPLDEQAWKAVCDKANVIYNYYALKYFPKDGNFSKMTMEAHDQGGIAMVSFLLNLSTSVQASAEQIREDILSLYTPFSTGIEKELGISVSEIVNICNFVGKTLQSRLDKGPARLVECYQQYREQLESGIDPEIAEANARRCMDESATQNFTEMGIIKFGEIEGAFSTDSANAFANLFAQKRASTSNPDDIIFPTEDLSVSLKPLAKLGDGNFALITGNHLVLAAQENFYKCLERMGLLERFNRHKGEFLEDKACHLLQGIIGNGAKYYQSVYETPDDQDEHDLLIVYKRALLIVECKAKRIRKGFRDVEESFPRIKDDFKAYIQEGYDQARQLEKLILNQPETKLYSQGGAVALIVKQSQFDQIEKIVVTYENEGILATKLSLLLELDAGDSFPLCLNMHNLRQLSSYKKYIRLTAKRFIEYIKQRKLTHGKIANDDELDIFGFFLKKNGLHEIIEADCDLFCIPPGFSSMFDEAYIKEKFPDNPPKKEKPGRNDPCHCGSGKKYKRCHGS